MLTNAIYRYLFGKEWISTDVFYKNEPAHKLGGSYWFWLFSSTKDDGPKVMLKITRMGINYKMDNLPVKNKLLKNNSFIGLVSCLCFTDGKAKKLFSEQCEVNFSEKELIAKTDSGLTVIVNGEIPNYSMSVKKSGKEILTASSSGSAPNKAKKIVHSNAFNKYSCFSEDKSTYYMFEETVRCPHLVKLLNVFSKFKASFSGEKFDGIAYAERNSALGAFAPWRYCIYDFEDGAHFRFFWIPKAPTKNPANFECFFDHNNKRYQFTSGKSEYFDVDWNKLGKFSDSVKYIKVNCTNGKESVEVISEIDSQYTFKYSSIGFDSNYSQIILKLKKLEIIGENLKITNSNLGKSVGYGEHVTLKSPLKIE